MKTKTVIETIEKTIYEAEDGNIFNSKYDCLLYEWKSQATAVYILHKLGQRSDEVEVYSTYEKAAEARGNSDVHMIVKVYVDYRTDFKVPNYED